MESDIPGRVGRYGFNCRLRSNGMGTYDLRVVDLSFKLGIIANEDQAANRKAFYPVVTTSSSFSIQFGWRSWKERERFNRWMRRFMRRSLRGGNINGVMHIVIPSREFVKDAVPTGPLVYGEAVGDLAYTSSMDFKGASDAIDLSLGERGLTSRYQEPKRGAGRAYYPASEQLSGAADLEGTIYDPHPNGPSVTGRPSQFNPSPRYVDERNGG